MYEFPNRVAVIGADGQLGWEICRQFAEQAIPLSRQELDLSNPPSIHAVLESIRPYAVINCAAYTLVDRAEDDPETCHLINADAVRHLAERCRLMDCHLVQVSTDYVFAGDTGGRRDPFREADVATPHGVYALAKYVGEQYAAQAPKHLIVRTCGLYGHAPDRGNFVRTMCRLARAQPVIRVVNDQYCSPTYVPHLARAISFLLHSSCTGLYHVVNEGGCSWFEFAQSIVRQVAPNVDVQPISSREFGAKAPRPPYSVLHIGKYQALGGPPMPTWRTALGEYFDREVAERSNQ